MYLSGIIFQFLQLSDTCNTTQVLKILVRSQINVMRCGVNFMHLFIF